MTILDLEARDLALDRISSLGPFAVVPSRGSAIERDPPVILNHVSFRSFVRHGDHLTDNRRRWHPTVHLPYIVADEELAFSRIFDEVKQVVVVPFHEDDIVDLYRRGIDRSDRYKLPALDPATH
jgi:hypothetical protein